jgi:hypothetical protein
MQDDFYHYEGISSVEDLDPEPQADRGLTHAREFAIGALLLLAVIGWSGWQWWYQQSVQTSYANGQRAVADYDWDGARANFLAAGQYRDARERATEAEERIAERDKHYKQARDAAGHNEWAVALKEVLAVRQVQPDYLDTGILKSEAAGVVYRDALSGTVALRTLADPPGLYYHSGREWVWLEGSDSYSRVRGYGPSTRLIYDVPGERWKPPPGPAPDAPSLFESNSGGSPRLVNRRLVVAHLNKEEFSFITLALDPSRYNWYVMTEQGVWAMVYNNRPLPETITSYGAISYYANYSLAFQSYSNPQVYRLEKPTDNWVVMDVSPTSDEVLEVEVVRTSEGGLVSNLYITNATGSYQRLVSTLPGGVFGRCQFGPDGQSVLVTTYSNVSQQDKMEQAILLFGSGWETSRLIFSQQAQVLPANVWSGTAPLGATFLSTFPAGTMLITEKKGDDLVFTIRNAGLRGSPTMMASVRDRREAPSPYWISEDERGRPLLRRGPHAAGRRPPVKLEQAVAPALRPARLEPPAEQAAVEGSIRYQPSTT